MSWKAFNSNQLLSAQKLAFCHILLVAHGFGKSRFCLKLLNAWVSEQSGWYPCFCSRVELGFNNRNWSIDNIILFSKRIPLLLKGYRCWWTGSILWRWLRSLMESSFIRHIWKRQPLAERSIFGSLVSSNQFSLRSRSYVHTNQPHMQRATSKRVNVAFHIYIRSCTCASDYIHTHMQTQIL